MACGGCLGLGSVGLFLTLSRGGWFSFAVVACVFCLLLWQRGWLSLGNVVSIVIVCAILLVALSGPITERITENDRGAASVRIPLMRIAFQMALDHPLFGVGANNFAVALPQYVTPEFGRRVDLYRSQQIFTNLGGKRDPCVGCFHLVPVGYSPQHVAGVEGK